ncbi:hypothetical protein [Streptomyces sp. ECR3.8]|uniref:hypothetical protein n=1 Tax=Streptomyces sp. ECR3.8 TaxID=3461009 RepID=UPI004042009B
MNDPTIAVQVLHHVDAFLHAVGRSELRGRHVLGDADGEPRTVVPGRSCEEYLELGFTEGREHGVDSLRCAGVCGPTGGPADGCAAGAASRGTAPAHLARRRRGGAGFPRHLPSFAGPHR